MCRIIERRSGSSGTDKRSRVEGKVPYIEEIEATQKD
jgi:hypothetical protein